MTSGVRIAPSVLSADLGRLAEQVAEVEEGGADWIHVDVMDGHFVPNLTVGAAMIEALKRLTKLPLDVHLMVERPEWYIAPFAEAGAAVFTFHPETTAHVHRQLNQVRACGMLSGLALNPATPLSYVNEVANDIDLLLVMTVNPGFPGQKYLDTTTQKIARARTLLAEIGSSAYLEVDGGITAETIGIAHKAGADTFVAGSAVFGSDTPGEAVRALRTRLVTAA